MKSFTRSTAVGARPRGRRLRWAGAVLAAALTTGLVGAPALAAELPGGSPDGRPGTGFTLPEGTPTPGAGFEVQSAYRVTRGVQIYSCGTGADGTGTWSTPTSTPEATLRRYGAPRSKMHHFGGPRWQARDGSTVVGAVAERVAKEGTIPWLLLTVTAHENSAPGLELDPVTHISRVNTTGGVGPTGACTPGDTEEVPYGADYVFWAPSS